MSSCYTYGELTCRVFIYFWDWHAEYSLKSYSLLRRLMLAGGVQYVHLFQCSRGFRSYFLASSASPASPVTASLELFSGNNFGPPAPANTPALPALTYSHCPCPENRFLEVYRPLRPALSIPPAHTFNSSSFSSRFTIPRYISTYASCFPTLCPPWPAAPRKHSIYLSCTLRTSSVAHPALLHFSLRSLGFLKIRVSCAPNNHWV